MDYLNPEPKFYSEEFNLVTLVFFLRIRGRDAVPVVFLILYVFFVLSASTQTAKFSLGQLDWNAKFSILKISTSTVELSGRKLVHCVRATCARDLVNFRKTKSCIARRAALILQFTLPGSGFGTLPSLELSHAIENQNSDFVSQ